MVQRVVFLHEDLVKLPSFPRKALEAELDLFEGGSIGKELQGVDVLHKFTWIRLISRLVMWQDSSRDEEQGSRKDLQDVRGDGRQLRPP